jgi:hypothetical protein
MTVAELIAKLQAMPQDAIVVVSDRAWTLTLDEVTLESADEYVGAVYRGGSDFGEEAAEFPPGTTLAVI